MVRMKRLVDITVRDISALGAIPASLALAVLFLLLGETRLCVLLLTGYAIIYAIILPIRAIHHKDRPRRVGYADYLEKLAAGTFPSVHAFRATFIAVLLSMHYATMWMIIVFAIYAVLVIGTRVYLKRHFWMDVLVGAILGALLGIGLSLA